MRWVTRVSGDTAFVLDTVDWLEHEYVKSAVLKLKNLYGVKEGTIFSCFSLYRRYYGLHNITIKGTHLDLEFTPTDVTLIKVKGNLEGKALVIPPVVTQIKGSSFYQAPLAIMDVSHFDMGKMTNMRDMFYGCQATELDVSHSDTSKVTDMGFMFACCHAKELNVSHFDTSKVTDMRGMFGYCQVTELDVSHFDTSQVTDMSFMFRSCQAKELNVSHFDISNVKDFSHMFLGYRGLIKGREHFPKEAFE